MDIFHSLKKPILLVGLLTLAACQNSSGGSRNQSLVGSVGGTVPEVPTEPPLASAIPDICSELSFENVTWPTDYRQSDQVAFSLAMNITGSYEGHAGWTNLSNNFDGQGVSLGILNQNLGQGTLQPLFIKMLDHHPEILKSAMTTSMLSSLTKMLEDWKKANPVVQFQSLESSRNFTERKPLDPSFDYGDVDKFYAVDEIQIRSNSDSVTWAKKNLYSDSKWRNFKPEWEKALKEISGHPTYVSLQIEAARYLHDQAHEHRLRLGWSELRSYLYLFDFVVQNGGLKDKHFEKFSDWLSKKPLATEQEQMLQMLEIRVVDSSPIWQEDVRLRKTTIIKGVGFVHGENRDLPIEYCYDPLIGYQTPHSSTVERP